MPLQDSDNFIIGRGTDSYKITYEDLKDDLNYVPPPTGTIDTPTVLEPNDGSGTGATLYPKTDAITAVEGGGIDTCETDLIESVDDTTNAPNITLTFPSSNGFGCFADGDVVQVAELGWQIIQNVDEIRNGANAFSGTADTTSWTAKANVNCSVKWLTDNYQGTTHKVTVRARTGSAGGAGATATITIAGNSQSVNTASFNIQAFDFPGVSNFSEILFETSGFDTNQGFLIESISIDDSPIIGSENGVMYGEAGAKVIDKDAGAVPPTITVDGGTWTTSDKLTKDIPYDTKLTLAGSTDLADMTGEVFSTDGTGAPGPYTQTPYKLTTTEIASVAIQSDWNQAHMWSNDLTTANAGTKLRLFDGDLDTIATGGTGSLVWTNTQNVTGPLRIYSRHPITDEINPHAAATTISVSATGAGINNQQVVPGWNFINYTGTVQSITIASNNPTSYSALANAIEFDGKLLVDLNVTGGLTETTLTFPGDVSTNPDLRVFQSG